MKLRLQFGGLLMAVGISAVFAMPCMAQKPQGRGAAQNRPANKPANPPRPPKQADRPPRNQGGQNGPNANARPGGNANPNGNRPPNPGGQNGQVNGNPNRPPNAGNPQSNARRFQDLTPQEKQKVLQNQEKFNRLPPQKQQEIIAAEKNWRKLTPEQQTHIKNDVLPTWKQMPPDRQKAIRQRLGVLQNMPESARNQHLNDPNFTRGMSEEDKAMLRDLSHMHVGAPDPPGE